MTKTVSILPKNQSFAKIHAPHELHYEAICLFLATGFFLDTDTFWKDEVCLKPGHEHTFDSNGYLIHSKPWFEWHYTPRDLTFNAALDEYVALLKEIFKDHLGDSKVILPISGGLDSRSQALVLRDLGNPVQSYSYAFKNGYPEHKIAKQVAQVCGFNFKAFEIQPSYLWECIDALALMNGCYSEFTHPRQMAILKDLKRMDGIISLGHWGDVLFDRGVPEGTKKGSEIELLKKKMVKKDGFQLAEKLWMHWQLEGTFKDYFESRLERALSAIKIDNLSARIRAFKTSQWAHRWTTTNLSVFESAHPISLPYYDNRMCEFICTVPEVFLADRKLQLAHLKREPKLAAITWQANKPFNLNNFEKNRTPFNLPYRITSKLKREVQSMMGKPFIQRNFELQFLGEKNDANLRGFLFNNSFNNLVPKNITEAFYNNFKNNDYVAYSHSVSMLLTLSLWDKHFFSKKS